MILEVKLNDGKKIVFGGNFSFFVAKEKHLFVKYDDYLSHYILKDYPTYSVGANIVFCEEAEG